MKALQEKRISLRSLWRRSLVFFSVVALAFAFASCNQTVAPGNGVEPPPPARTPVSMVIAQFPANASGVVFEGQLVDLTGIVVNVFYSDGTWGQITDPGALSIFPPVYTVANRGPGGTAAGAVSSSWANLQVAFGGTDLTGHGTERQVGYILSYTENGTTISINIVTSTGFNPAVLTVGETVHRMGIHRPLLDVVRTGELIRQDFYIDEIPDFRGIRVEGIYWAGVGELPDQPPIAGDVPLPGPGVAVSGENFIQRHIPVSTEFPWAWVYNRHAGFVGQNPGVLVNVGSWGAMEEGSDPEHLTGLRIPVGNLWQVASVEVTTPPNFAFPLFFDDRRFFTADIELDTSPASTPGEFWADDISDPIFWRWVNEVLAGTVITVTYTGGSPRVFPIYRLASMPMLAPVDAIGGERLGGFWDGLRFRAVDRRGVPLNIGTGAGWDTWLLEANPRLAVDYRGRQALIDMPIFNRLELVEVVPRTGNGPVVLNGLDRVYRRGDDAHSFFRDHVRVIATYSLGSDRSITATREDVFSDVINGRTARGFNLDNSEWNLFADSDLWSNNVHTAGAGGGLLAGILTEANSNIFNDRGTLRRANVNFVAQGPGGAGRDRQGRIDIGMINY